MTVTLQYWEFDYLNQRHHCLEMKLSLIIKLSRLITRSKCQYAVCGDHLEVFCMIHQGETIKMNFKVREIFALRQYIKEARENESRK